VHIKLSVKLEPDEEGYPPVRWEGLWAIDLGGGLYRIDNIPFYARDLALGDVVAALCGDEGLIYQRRVAASGHSTLRVLVFEDGQAQPIRSELAALGCATELSQRADFFSVDVPAHVDYAGVAAVLQRHATAGRIDYEESALRH
jgi:hypothetical protein